MVRLILTLTMSLALYSLSARGDQGTQFLEVQSVDACRSEANPFEEIYIFNRDIFPFSTLHWWAAKESQVKKASCRHTAYSTAELEKEISLLIPPRGKKISKVIHGLQIENENEHLVSWLEKLLTATDLIGRAKPANQKSFASNCKTVLCAIKDPSVFGPDLGPRVLFLIAKYNYNSSHYVDPQNRSAWRADELDDVLLAFSDFPPHALNKLGGFIYHSIRGKSENIANARIEVSDGWDQLSSLRKQYAIFHEIAHNLGRFHDIVESKAWIKLGSWKEEVENNKWRSSARSSVASKYGRENPTEDFAEAISGYRYHPKVLKKRSPMKYQLIKETIFDGLEYTSSEACDPRHSFSNRLSVEVESIVAKELEQPAQKTLYLAQLHKLCGHLIIDGLRDMVIDEHDKHMINRCIRLASVKFAYRMSELSKEMRFPEFSEASIVSKASQMALSKLPLTDIEKDLVIGMKEPLVSFLKDFTTRIKDKRNRDSEKIDLKVTNLAEYGKNISEFAFLNADQVGLGKEFDEGGNSFNFTRREVYSELVNAFLAEFQKTKSGSELPDHRFIENFVEKHLEFQK